MQFQDARVASFSTHFSRLLSSSSISSSTSAKKPRSTNASASSSSSSSTSAAASVTWPLSLRGLDPESLAQAGFFYTPDREIGQEDDDDDEPDDQVTCFLCEKKLGGWENGDDAMEEHWKRARSGTQGGKAGSGSGSGVVCGWAQAVCSVILDEKERSEKKRKRVALSSTTTKGKGKKSTKSIDTLDDEDEDDRTYSQENEHAFPRGQSMTAARVATYGKGKSGSTGGWWPYSRRKGWLPTPMSLSQAGFVYTPTEVDPDCVTCFYCSYSVAGWEATDDPWALHERKSPGCAMFVSRLEGEEKGKRVTEAREEADVDGKEHDGEVVEVPVPVTKRPASRATATKSTGTTKRATTTTRTTRKRQTTAVAVSDTEVESGADNPTAVVDPITSEQSTIKPKTKSKTPTTTRRKAAIKATSGADTETQSETEAEVEEVSAPPVKASRGTRRTIVAAPASSATGLTAKKPSRKTVTKSTVSKGTTPSASDKESESEVEPVAAAVEEDSDLDIVEVAPPSKIASVPKTKRATRNPSVVPKATTTRSTKSSKTASSTSASASTSTSSTSDTMTKATRSRKVEAGDGSSASESNSQISNSAAPSTSESDIKSTSSAGPLTELSANQDQTTPRPRTVKTKSKTKGKGKIDISGPSIDEGAKEARSVLENLGTPRASRPTTGPSRSSVLPEMVGLTLEESEMTVLNYVRQTYNTKLESLRTLGEDKILAWVMKSGESRKVIEDIACWDEEEDEEDVFGGSNAKSSSSQQAFLSVAEKRDLLENFDLEVEDRTRVFTSALKNVLDSFLIRQESEIMRIPRDLRNQTMSTLNAVWGGDWGKTLQQLKSEVLKERKEEAMQEVVAQVEDKKKRKRGDAPSAASTSQEGDSGPARKTARRQPSNLETAVVSAYNKTKRAVSSKRAKAGASVATPSTTRVRVTRAANTTVPASPVPARTPLGPLASNRLVERSFVDNAATPKPYANLSVANFAPAIPSSTPRFPRQMREDEMVLSANGSPIANYWNPSSSIDDSEGSEDELPDADEMERKLLAASSQTSRLAPVAQATLGVKKRVSTIRIRQSGAHLYPTLGGGDQTTQLNPTPRYSQPKHMPGSFISPSPGPQSQSNQFHFSPESPKQGQGAVVQISTSCGLIVAFNPLNDNMRAVDQSLLDSGVEAKTREEVRVEMIKSVRELQERLSRFDI